MSSGVNNTNEKRPYFRGSVPVAYALLGAPVAWVAHLSVNYFLVQPVCQLGGGNAFHVSGIVFLLIAIGSGVMAWRFYRKNRPNTSEAGDIHSGMSGFVALFGVASALIFSIAIISQWVPVFMVGPCVGTL